MLKKILLAGSAIVAVSGFAHAADMPVKAYAAPVAVYDWSGIYLGGVVGGAWGTDDLSAPGLGVLGTLVNFPVVQSNNSSDSSAASRPARATSSASWWWAGKATSPGAS